MPFTSMVTSTGDGAGPEGPQTSGGGATDAETDPEAQSDEDRIAALEAKVASLESDRNRLLAERHELHARYEQVLREERRDDHRARRPSDDGLLLRIARRLGLR